MKKITYIREDDLLVLATKVNDQLQKGWELYGPLLCYNIPESDIDQVYIQAMTLFQSA